MLCCLSVKPIRFSALRTVPFIVLCICCVAAYGHVVNDIFDIEADGLTGRPNAMAQVAPGGRRLLVALLLVMGAFGVAALPTNPMAIGLLALNYVLPTVYSAPPLRLKERGLAGVVSDTLGSHVVPTLFVAALLLGAAGWQTGIASVLVLSAAGWALCLGLRGILVHQIFDQEGDRAASVITFASRKGPGAVRSFVIKVILPLEAVSLVIFVALLLPVSNILLGAVLLFLLGEVSRVVRGVRLPLVYPHESGLEPHVPLLKNDFYEVWLPCALAVQLSLYQPGYLWLLAWHVILFHRVIMEVAVLVTRFLRQQLGRVWSSS